jgi:polar amino acid transport system substrate-binding protein
MASFARRESEFGGFMKSIRRILIPMMAAVLLGPSPSATARETITVGLEPFPPFIVDAETGYTITLLRRLEAASDLTFHIRMLSYSRAKSELKNGKTDLIAHTPHGLETDAFYAFAQELDWRVETRTDLYAMEPDRLTRLADRTIGIPRGNEEFFSELSGIPMKNLYPGNLENLLKMLEAGRIDAFWFERAATMTQLKGLQMDGVYYRQMPEMPVSAGIAVARTPAGTRLKETLDALLEDTPHADIFAPYRSYMELPPEGRFMLDE